MLITYLPESLITPLVLQCDAESNYLEQTTTSNVAPSNATPEEKQIELVMSEVRRLEEVALRNEDELGALSQASRLTDDVVIQGEISELRQRLVGTDHELQKTNSTLR